MGGVLCGGDGGGARIVTIMSERKKQELRCKTQTRVHCKNTGVQSHSQIGSNSVAHRSCVKCSVSKSPGSRRYPTSVPAHRKGQGQARAAPST